MKRRIAVLIVLLTASAFSLFASPSRNGEPAPLFAAKDLDGKRVALEDMRDSLVVIHFATSW